jgi:hypothetical protein
MSQRWHYEKTSDGWSIKDENGLLVATVHNPPHDREDDARLIAEAPTTLARLHRFEPPVEAVRAQLVKEMVVWISSTIFSSGRAHRYHERATLLARRMGVERQALLDEIQREAEAQIAREDES